MPALRGRRTSGLRAGEPKARDVTLPDLAQAHRRLLHRRHQGAALCAARPWCSAACTPRPTPMTARQAARRAAGQGPPHGRAVRGRSSPTASTPAIGRQRHRDRAGALKSRLAARARLPLLLWRSPTNQQFVILPNEPAWPRIREACREVRAIWEKYDEHPHRRAHRHQLGHDAGGHRRVGGCPVA